MKTADAIKIMALAADARVIAYIKQLERQLIDPIMRKTIEMIERQELHRRVWQLFYGYKP